MADLIALLSSSPPWFIGTCAVFGLLVGSFLNVVIYRVPVMLERQWREQCMELAATSAAPGPARGSAGAPEGPFNLMVPRSACPACKAPITALQNIPVVSWLFLKGRCARCSSAISVRYPLIEALTGVLTALVAWKFGFGWLSLAGIVLTWFLISL